MSNVLVVDDNPEILEAIKLILCLNNFEVVAISSAEEVNDNLSNPRPDVILLDINLGGPDGREICRNIKASSSTKDIPVILFSAEIILKMIWTFLRQMPLLRSPLILTSLLKLLKPYVNNVALRKAKYSLSLENDLL
jgi:CheY-like chemotaxis protein